MLLLPTSSYCATELIIREISCFTKQCDRLEVTFLKKQGRRFVVKSLGNKRKMFQGFKTCLNSNLRFTIKIGVLEMPLLSNVQAFEKIQNSYVTLKWTWFKVIGSTVAAVLELAQKPRRPPRGRILHFQATLFLCAVQAFWRNTIKWMYRTQGKGSTHDALYKYLYAVWHKLQKGFILCCANAAPQDSRRSQAIDLLQKPVGQFPFYTASHHPCYTAW